MADAAVVTVVQFGQAAKTDRKQAQVMLDGIIGPIPRYLFSQLTDDELAKQVKDRWLAKRVDQSARTMLDLRLLSWLTPEKVQDQWSSMWTGRPYKKLYHDPAAGLHIGVYNWVDPVVSSLVGILAGYKPFPYELEIEPRDPMSEAAALQTDMVEDFLHSWRRRSRYPRVMTLGVTNLVALGRWIRYAYTEGNYETCVKTIWPGHAALFWQSDLITIEQATIASYLTAGEAVARWPEKRGLIEAALMTPSARGSNLGSANYNDNQGWLRQTTATVLTNWYRGEDEKIGKVEVLVGGPSGKDGKLNAVVLEKGPDSKYTDVPVRCTPFFQVPNRPPDEAHGVIFKIAPINTEFNEVMSATHDMLGRAFFPKYTAAGFNYKNGPRPIARTSMLALPRSDQAIKKIEDTINTQGPENFANKLEEQMLTIGMLNRLFFSTPPSQLSGDAIDAAMDAISRRIAPVRTNLEDDEIWTHTQVIDQQRQFGRVTASDGSTVDLRLILDGAFDINLRWLDTFTNDVKQKQLALAGLGRVHGLDTAQHMWGIGRRSRERARMKRERMDITMFPQFVSQYAAAMTAMLNAKREQAVAARIASGQPMPAPPQVRVSLAGQLSPEEVMALSEIAGVPKGTPGPVPPPVAGTRAMPGRQPVAIPAGPGAAAPGGNPAALAARAAASAAAAAAPPNVSMEGDNAPGGMGGPAMPGDMANPSNASPDTGTGTR